MKNIEVVISANEVLKNIHNIKYDLEKAYQPMHQHIKSKFGNKPLYSRINEKEYEEKLKKAIKVIMDLEDVFISEYKQIHQEMLN